MQKNYAPLLLCSALIVQGCGQDQSSARTVQEYLDNPQFLEAAVVRCSQNRSESRYDAECVKARQAVSIVEAREESARRDQLEAESASKRDALRRTQHAAAEARRRAAEAEQLQKEAEYLAQFGATPPAPSADGSEQLKGNVPGAVIPAASPPPRSATPVDDTPPVSGQDPQPDGAQPSLDVVRDELRRRQEEGAG